MRKTLGVSLLVLLLTAPAIAGEMPNGSPTPPPSDPADGIIHTGSPAASDGIIQGGTPAATAEDGDNTDALTQIALTLLVSVLS